MSNIHNVYISLNYDPTTKTEEKPWITLCLLGNCSNFLSSVFFFVVCLFFFFKISFVKNFIMDTIRVSNSMKIDQVHIFSDRMWFQTVYNDNQHTTPAGKEMFTNLSLWSFRAFCLIVYHGDFNEYCWQLTIKCP